MGKQDLGCLVHGKTGNMLRHEVFANGPVDEAAQDNSAVELRKAYGRGDIVECDLTGLI